MKHPIKVLFTGGLLALSLLGAAAAGPVEDGFAAGNRGDYATALKLLRPLAEQGDAQAQYGMGQMYDNGLGVRTDHDAAADWYRKAADQGLAPAQTALGLLYDLGWGAPQDDAQAGDWYRKAADQGDPGGQFYLGGMYDRGRGVTQDPVQAYALYGLAASRYPQDDAEHRDEAVKARDRIAAKMTPAQIAEAERLIREWVPK